MIEIMSTEIVVRLPDAIIEFIDSEVGAGHSCSRAAVILRALEREHHRRVLMRNAAADAAGLGSDDTDDTAGFAGYRSVLWSDPMQRR
jgi:hypothetical protein